MTSINIGWKVHLLNCAVGIDAYLRKTAFYQNKLIVLQTLHVNKNGILDKTSTWMGGTPPYGYDLRYENAEGKFLFILRYMPDRSKQILDEDGNLTRTLARGESLSISKRDHARLVPGDPKRVKIIKRLFQMYAEQGKGYRSLGPKQASSIRFQCNGASNFT